VDTLILKPGHFTFRYPSLSQVSTLLAIGSLPPLPRFRSLAQSVRSITVMPGIGGIAEHGFEAAKLGEEDRGRDGDRSPPPAQTRTGPTKASGSYLEYLTAKRCCGQG
jgi:hypothetical protein